MKRLAKIAKGNAFSDDPDKLGWIKVKLEGEITWARPHFSFGEIRIPTKEWVDKFADFLGLWVERIEESEHLVWTGWCLWKLPIKVNNIEIDEYPDELRETVGNYPYTNLIFTENWKIAIDDPSPTYFDIATADVSPKLSNKLTISNVDGTFLKIDRTTGLEEFRFEDKSGNRIIMNDRYLDFHQGFTGHDLLIQAVSGSRIRSNGHVLEIKTEGVTIDGQPIVLKPFVDWLIANQASIGLGNTGPVPIFPSAAIELNTKTLSGLPAEQSFLSNNIGINVEKD